MVYRSVALKCGDLSLSIAENWYVPARLTPEMNAALAGDTPFGAAIHPLTPSRRTLGIATQGEDATVAPYVLRQRALVIGGNGRPLAEVVEDLYAGADRAAGAQALSASDPSSPQRPG